MAGGGMHHLRAMLRCAILAGLAVMAVLTFSIAEIQAGPSARVQAINTCRAELGKHAKYMDVRACVLRKMKGE
jgi:hypothetical protein